MWSAFAKFGLGVDAVSGGSNSTRPTNGFKLPDACRVDNIPPVVSISAPASGAIVSGTTTVTASASDSVGVTKVEFFIDNNLIDTDNTAPYRFSWDTTTLSNGSHSLSGKAYDDAGNIGSSNSVTVSVNNGSDGLAVFDPVLKAPKCTRPGTCQAAGNQIVNTADRVA